MGEVYYTVPVSRGKKKKFRSLEEAQDFCEKLDGDVHNIEKCVLESEIIPYTVKRKSNSTDDVRELVERVVSALCSADLTRLDCEVVCFCAEIYIRFKNIAHRKGIDGEKIESLILDYMKELVGKYPADEIEVKKLKTDRKPCNAILINFRDCRRFVRSGVCNPYRSDLDMAPDNFCIQLRGDSPDDMSICIDEWDENCGKDVADLRKEFVDLSDGKVREYIDRVLSLLDK